MRQYEAALITNKECTPFVNGQIIGFKVIAARWSPRSLD
jgi:hypothetical protein